MTVSSEVGPVHAMKRCGGVEVHLHSFVSLTLARDLHISTPPCIDGMVRRHSNLHFKEQPVCFEHYAV